mgnify:CR=1 FL=1
MTRLGAARVLATRYEVELADAVALPVAAALGLRPGRHAVEATVEPKSKDPKAKDGAAKDGVAKDATAKAVAPKAVLD